jgi:hypothetical protein
MKIGQAPSQKEREQPIICHLRQTVQVTHPLLESEQIQWE